MGDHARKTKRIKATEKELDDTQIELANATTKLNLITALVPSAAALLGFQSTHIGKMKTLTPLDCLFLVRACFLKSTTQCSIGVKLKRLVLFMAKLVCHRQAEGLTYLLQKSSLALVSHTSAHIHVAYHHLWDEVLSKFAMRHDDQGHRTSSMGVSEQVLAQHGFVQFTMHQVDTTRCSSFSNDWLIRPMRVDGTRAEHVMPALLASVPSQFKWTDTSAMKALVASCSSFTFMPLCDKASGNIRLLHYFAYLWESSINPATKGSVKIWAETCTAHLHHRCKLQLKGVKYHIARHFCIANLVRLGDVQRRIRGNIEDIVPNMLVRQTASRPAGLKGNLNTFVELLFKPDAAHHTRTTTSSGEQTNSQQMCEYNLIVRTVSDLLELVGARNVKLHVMT